MEKYNGKNVRLTLAGYNKNLDLIKGGTHYFRGTVGIDLEPQNEVIDDSLDGSLFLAEDSALPSKRRGSFSTSQLIVNNNMFSVLVNGFFNQNVENPFPIVPNYDPAEKDLVAILVDDKVNAMGYMGRPQEITIKVDGDEKFIVLETKGDIASYDNILPSMLDGKQKVTGKPFLVNEATVEDTSGNVYASIKSVEATFKNGMSLMEIVGDDGNYLPASFEGTGKLTVVWNTETKTKWASAMSNLTTMSIVIKGSDADGNTLEVRMPACKIIKTSPDYERKSEVLLREFEFIVVDNGVDTPLSVNFF